MSKYLFIFFITVSFFSNKIFAQSEVGLHFMDVMQISKTNPAWIGKDTLQIALPNLHLNYFNTAGAFNELILDYINTSEQLSLGIKYF